MRAAIIDTVDGIVSNVILFEDGEIPTGWEVPAGMFVRILTADENRVSPGWSWDDTNSLWVEGETKSRVKSPLEKLVEESSAVTEVSRIVVKDKIKSTEGLDNETATNVSTLFPELDLNGVAVAVGDVFRWNGTLVEVVQAHTTQTDWTPEATPALFKVYRDPETETPAEWVQPTGAQDAYNTGDQVTFEGAVYESLIDANTWSPTDYPEGWQLIE